MPKLKRIYFRMNWLMIAVIMILLLVFAKVFQFTFLPAKYFTDGNVILYSIWHKRDAFQGFGFIADFFRVIDIFHFTTLKQWAISLTIVFFFPYWIIMKRVKRFTAPELFFFFCNIFLSGIYVFNLSKEIFQVCVSFVIYHIVTSNGIKRRETKTLLIFLCFALEGVVFRKYYLLIAGFYLLLYFFANKAIKTMKFAKFLLITFFSVFIFVFFLQFLSYETYLTLISVRYSLTYFRIGDDTAQTLIVDLIHTNHEFMNWCLNYVLNAFRMFFPIELLFKGVKYFPFVVYQILLSWFYRKSYREYGRGDYRFGILFFLYTAYALVSVIFEPDFGSWVRHETAMWPILFLLFFRDAYPAKLQRRKDRKNWALVAAGAPFSETQGGYDDS